MRPRFYAISLLLSLLFSAAFLGPRAEAAGIATRFQVKPPMAMPEMVFEDGSGRQVNLKDFRGRYVLLNLWATWCGPCTHEMPSLDGLQGKIEGLMVLALSEDEDGKSVAAGFFKRHNITNLPVYVDTSGEAPNVLHANGLPTTLLIDPVGREVGRLEGDANWSDPESVSFLSSQMKPLSSFQPPGKKASPSAALEDKFR